MPMIMSQILQFEDSRKMLKPKYLENETLFFLQIKISVHYTLRAKLHQKTSFIVL